MGERKSRAEWRRSQREGQKSQKVYHLTAQQLNGLKRQAAAEAVKKINERVATEVSGEIFCWTLTAMLWTIRQKHRWGEKRLGDIAEAVTDLYNGEVPLLEIQENLYKETGLKIKME